jgi:hypothetical protein
MLDDVRNWSDLIGVAEPLKEVLIQVKFHWREFDNQAFEEQAFNRAMILISPWTIAHYSEHGFNPSQFGQTWSEFLLHIPKRVQDTSSLALQYYNYFDEIIEKEPSHPLGPAFDVNQTLRQIIVQLLISKSKRLRWAP